MARNEDGIKIKTTEFILVDSWLLIKIVVTFRAARLNAKKCANVYNIFYLVELF